MRHRLYGKYLGRDKDERDILFKGLIRALFTHGTIQTTEAKAKAIKGMADKVINRAKAKKSFELGLTKEILLKLGSRTSGYTSMIKVGTRVGDQTRMVKMSLIGAEELKPIEKESRVKSQESRIKKVSTPKKSTKSTTRRQRKV